MGPDTVLDDTKERLMFDGNERKYEQWEVKFLGYMTTKTKGYYLGSE